MGEMAFRDVCIVGPTMEGRAAPSDVMVGVSGLSLQLWAACTMRTKRSRGQMREETNAAGREVRSRVQEVVNGEWLEYFVE